MGIVAHYAFLNENNVVTEVIVGIDETETIENLTPEQWYENFRGQKCVRTSYTSSIRYNYAGIGYTYDSVDDAFIPPMPQCGHDELNLDTSIYQWKCTNEEHNVDLS